MMSVTEKYMSQGELEGGRNWKKWKLQIKGDQSKIGVHA